jgi:hypothetical protein
VRVWRGFPSTASARRRSTPGRSRGCRPLDRGPALG